MTQITISEVGPRDGLQSVETVLSTEGKLAWIEMEYGAGVREIEVGSFVSPKLLPQMSDTADVVRVPDAIQIWSSQFWCLISEAVKRLSNPAPTKFRFHCP